MGKEGRREARTGTDRATPDQARTYRRGLGRAQKAVGVWRRRRKKRRLGERQRADRRTAAPRWAPRLCQCDDWRRASCVPPHQPRRRRIWRRWRSKASLAKHSRQAMRAGERCVGVWGLCPQCELGQRHRFSGERWQRERFLRAKRAIFAASPFLLLDIRTLFRHIVREEWPKLYKSFPILERSYAIPAVSWISFAAHHRISGSPVGKLWLTDQAPQCPSISATKRRL